MCGLIPLIHIQGSVPLDIFCITAFCAVVLRVMVLYSDHKGDYLASKLTDAISPRQLEGKIQEGVRDNAANMICAMHIVHIIDVSCMAHTLQLVIRDALFTQSRDETLVKKACKLVSHFKHTEQSCCRKREEGQKTCNLTVHKLLQDVETVLISC